MASVIKSSIIILSVFSSFSLSFGHRFLLQEQEHPNHDDKDTDLPRKGAAVTLGDHMASKIGGKIPEIHTLCQRCNCGGGSGSSSDNRSNSGNPLSDIPLIGDIIPEITGILGIPFPGTSETPQTQESPRVPLVQDQATPVCGCCGQRCGGTCGCGCNKGRDGHEIGDVFEDAKNEPLPPFPEVERQDAIVMHN